MAKSLHEQFLKVAGDENKKPKEEEKVNLLLKEEANTLKPRLQKEIQRVESLDINDKKSTDGMIFLDLSGEMDKIKLHEYSIYEPLRTGYRIEAMEGYEDLHRVCAAPDVDVEIELDVDSKGYSKEMGYTGTSKNIIVINLRKPYKRSSYKPKLENKFPVEKNPSL